MRIYIVFFDKELFNTNNLCDSCDSCTCAIQDLMNCNNDEYCDHNFNCDDSDDSGDNDDITENS